MVDLTQKAARILSAYADKKIAVGVSGGRDSMCLLHAVVGCGAVARERIVAVHVNHGLRETAARDEKFVREFCEKNDIEFKAFAVDVKGESAKNRLTIEQAARSLRYDIFYELIKTRAADCILTAHHALDNAESVLMHVFRGAGLDGLRGMNGGEKTAANETVSLHMFRGAGLDGLRGMNGDGKTAANETVSLHMFRGADDGLRGMNGDGKTADNTLFSRTREVAGDELCCINANTNSALILRPFIDVYPRELDEYAAAHGIEYVTDETNFETAADRNFLRLNVIPLIEQRYGGAVRAINELARECREACAVLDDMLDPSQIVYDRGAVLISDSALSGALGARYVRRALEYFSLTDVTREQISSVVRLVGMRTGASTALACGAVAAREYGAVAVYVPREKYDGESALVLGANYIDGLVVDVLKSEINPREIKGGAVDLARLSGATLRFRRDGDMFTPYGGGTKKLKEYFIDNKLPRRLRDRTPLVCVGSTVLVIVGVQVSAQAAQTPATAEKGVVALRW